MKLLEAEIGKYYTIDSVDFCNDCKLDVNSCEVLSIMERGLVPDSKIKIISKKFGMIQLQIDSSIPLVIRNESFKRLNIKIR